MHDHHNHGKLRKSRKLIIVFGVFLFIGMFSQGILMIRTNESPLLQVSIDTPTQPMNFNIVSIAKENEQNLVVTSVDTQEPTTVAPVIDHEPVVASSDEPKKGFIESIIEEESEKVDDNTPKPLSAEKGEEKEDEKENEIPVVTPLDNITNTVSDNVKSSYLNDTELPIENPNLPTDAVDVTQEEEASNIDDKTKQTIGNNNDDESEELEITEWTYPCMDFPKHAKNKGKFHTHDPNGVISFPVAMKTLYVVTRHLAHIEKKLGVQFVILHGTLIGQQLTKRVLPWDDDLDVSISMEDSKILDEYITSFPMIGKLEETEFYYDNESDALWYIDRHWDHHIEYRVYSGCERKTDPQLLMLIEENNKCPRTYADITVLYESNRDSVKMMMKRLRLRSFPSDMREKVFYYKALQIAKKEAKLKWIAGWAHVYNVDDIFPTQKCLFNGVMMNCPANIKATLVQEYSMKVYNHVYHGLKLNDDGCWVGA